MKNEDFIGLIIVLVVAVVSCFLAYKVTGWIINSDLPTWLKIVFLMR